jgi:hypothetical protein
MDEMKKCIIFYMCQSHEESNCEKKFCSEICGIRIEYGENAKREEASDEAKSCSESLSQPSTKDLFEFKISFL